jgi:hypothetical protein
MPNPQNLIGKGFKPGQSGNPAGRTVGSKNMATLAREMLENEGDTIDLLVRTKTGFKTLKQKYPAKALLQVLMAKALDGDIAAYRELRRTAYGDKVDMTVSNAESALSDWHNDLKEQDEQLARDLATTTVNKPTRRPKKQTVAPDPSIQDKE